MCVLEVEGIPRSTFFPNRVIPVKTGIQTEFGTLRLLDSRLRGTDGKATFVRRRARYFVFT